MIIENKQVVNANNGLYIDRVEEVTNQKDLQIILKCAKEWKKSAEKKISYYTKNKNTVKLPIANDAKWVATSMIELLSKDGNNEPAYSLETFKKNENAIFGAYDNKGFLQGAAFVDLTSRMDWDNVLDDILVNPERNGIIGKRELRTAFKGIGTKLIQAVVKKIMQKKGEQNLGT
ncbi:MAG: hypothetical protein H0U27_05010, partial [Nitrosopumilus sp.]|nr:hypothetical protein [Nitrosopumilus sp.]